MDIQKVCAESEERTEVSGDNGDKAVVHKSSVRNITKDAEIVERRACQRR